FVQIKISELLYCYSEDSITFGVTAKKRFIIEETMDELFSSLDQNEFYRINRGQIIAKTAIQKINPYFNHRVKLSISNPRDQEFIVSRPKTSDFKKWMNK
ncbi:MAG: LytTR family DNA-binding domain-containing protein, partial [Bacteroidota bacterium]